mmetsp:Transcript_38150/g.59603  ORF Transcript_38150/g.59603 Transcript_38150/m.59603 type:complete len:233 (-) Transcript_38150:315-1013(-)
MQLLLHTTMHIFRGAPLLLAVQTKYPFLSPSSLHPLTTPNPHHHFLSHKLPLVHHDLANALERVPLYSGVIMLNQVHHSALGVDMLDDTLAVGVEADELANVVAGDGHHLVVRGVQQGGQGLDEGEVVGLHGADVLLPELLRVADAPAQGARAHLLRVHLEGAELVVVLHELRMQHLHVRPDVRVRPLPLPQVAQRLGQPAVQHLLHRRLRAAHPALGAAAAAGVVGVLPLG